MGAALGQFIFPSEQQTAFEAARTEMRQRGGKMSAQELFAVAKAKLNVVAKHWAESRKISVAKQIAKSITKGFDLQKSRPQPKESRAAKQKRYLRIAAYYLDAARDFPPSYRDIAKKFGISSSSAHRILHSQGLISAARSRSLNVSKDAAKLIFMLDRAFPLNRCRLVSSKDIETALEFTGGILKGVIDELMSMNHPLQLVDLGISTGNVDRSTWLVIQRGKGKSLESLRLWAATKINLMQCEPRARVDQLIVFRLLDAALDRNSVLADLCSVLEIADGSTNIQAWSAFIEASTYREPSTSGTLCIQDVGGIVNIVNAAVRRNSLQDKLLSMHTWVSKPEDVEGSAKLFRLAHSLQNQSFYPAIEAIQFWLDATNYRDRVVSGEMPGRRSSDLSVLQSLAHIEDSASLVEALRSKFGSALNEMSEMEDFSAAELNQLDDGFIYPLEEEED